MSVKAVDVLDAGLKSQGLIVEQEKIWNFLFVQIGIADGLPLECTETLIRNNGEIA